MTSELHRSLLAIFIQNQLGSASKARGNTVFLVRQKSGDFTNRFSQAPADLFRATLKVDEWTMTACVSLLLRRQLCNMCRQSDEVDMQRLHQINHARRVRHMTFRVMIFQGYLSAYISAKTKMENNLRNNTNTWVWNNRNSEGK